MGWVPDPSSATGFTWQDDAPAPAQPAPAAPPTAGSALPPTGGVLDPRIYTDVGGLSLNGTNGAYYDPATGQRVTDPNIIAAAIARSRSSSSTSSSSNNSSSTSDIGPIAAANDEANRQAAAANTAATIAEQQRQLEATVKQQQAQLQQQIAEANQKNAIDQANLGFLRDKQAFEESMSLKTAAQATQQQLFTQQQTVAQNQLQIAQMQSQHDQLQAQLDQSTAQFNATESVNVAKLNADALTAKQDRIQKLGTDIGTLAADPGDRAKLASTILANSGWGQANTAMAGTDFRTPESLTPLQGLLNDRTSVMASPDNPYTFNPIASPQVPGLDLSKIQMPQVPAAPPPIQPVQGVQTQIGTAITNPAAIAASAGNNGVTTSANGTQTGGGFTWSPTGTGGIQAAANGGFLGGAYISGEKGPEINIPMGGKTLILNADEAKQAGIDIKALIKAKANGVAKYADGGVFGDATLPDTSGASDFLAQSSLNARAGTPWAGTGTLPTPVYASTPGFNPLVAQLLASLTAQQQGIPASYFLQQAQMLQPTAIQDRGVNRSA